MVISEYTSSTSTGWDERIHQNEITSSTYGMKGSTKI